MSHQLFISVGSNIEREKYTQAGLNALRAHFDNVRCSRVFETESIGFDGSPFYNFVAKAQTRQPLHEVIDTLKHIERENGRTHGEKKFCSRTLDLDLLIYDKLVTTHPVVLPREEILYNAFVLQPLAELAPDEVHPLVNFTYRQLWHDFDKSTQRLWPIDFKWSIS